MSTPVAYREATDFTADADYRAASPGELPPDVMRPLLEGARARGMADAFELIGVPAVLIDAAGAVLHVGPAAEARMGGAISVASRHLVGSDPASNRALQDVVATALAGQAKMVKLEAVAAGGGLCVKAIPMPCGRENPYQLMKAIVVFDVVSKSVDEPLFGD